MPGLKHQMRGWTPGQRGVVMALVGGLLVYAVIFGVVNRRYVPDSLPAEGPLAAQMASRLDPNTASADELAMIPNIGPGRARQIVAYRERVVGDDPKAVAFQKPEDLLRVKGIGWSLLNHMIPHLLFPDSDTPSVEPANNLTSQPSTAE